MVGYWFHVDGEKLSTYIQIPRTAATKKTTQKISKTQKIKWNTKKCINNPKESKKKTRTDTNGRSTKQIIKRMT